MRKFFFILIGLFVIMLSACRSHRQVVQHETHDSTTVSFLEVEKIIRIPGDTVRATMQVVPVQTRQCLVSTSFIPQKQIIETKRSKVTIELSGSGEITATAICKELEETIVVLEKTISNYKSEVTEYQVKESRLKSALAEMRSWLKGILFSLLLIAVVVTAFKLGFNPISIFKKLISKP